MPHRLILVALAALVSPLFGQSLPASGTSQALEAAARIGSQIEWVADDPRLLREGDRAERQRLVRNRTETKDFDRVAALDEALAKAKELKRPVLLYVPRILAGARGRQMYRPAILDLYARSIFFTDPECRDRVNARFVPLRLICDAKLGERLGITAPERVEPAFVFLSPEGKVLRIVDRIRSFNAHWFLELLTEVHGKHPAPLETAADEPLARAKELLLRQRQGYEIPFPDPSTFADAGASVRSAITLLHLRHNRAQAADLLDLVQVKPVSAPPSTTEERAASAHLHLELAHLLTLCGKLDEARTALGEASRRAMRAYGRRAKPNNLELFPDCRAEIFFRLGVAQFFQGQDSQARRSMLQALEADPESPFAWKAALNLVNAPDLTALGPTLHGFEDPFLARKTRETTARVDVANPREQIESAVEFLLRMQRENGSWSDSRYAYWGTKSLTPNVWMASTALACAALLEWRHVAPERIDTALARGEAYIRDERRMARGHNEEIYADAYRLLYLSQAHDREADRRKRRALVESMDEIIRQLMNTQKDEGKAKGFWAHEYPNPFCTAAVMSALRAAKLRGATLPPNMMLDGAKGLLRIRDPKSGGFSYSAGRKAKNLDPKDSMARMPICEAVILWSGHEEGSEERVAAAMDNFWKYLPRLEKIRVCDFHTDGELGGFFYWHGIFHTTEAIGALGKEKQPEHRQKMAAHIQKLQELDGSFIDSHEIGKSYGTAMALLALKKALETTH